MRKLLAGGLAVLLFVVTGFAVQRGPSSAAFTVKCGQYNYCTFTNTSGTSGTWVFKDITESYPLTGVSVMHAMSTHDPVTFATPYTTRVIHTAGAAVDTGYVRCTAQWDP